MSDLRPISVCRCRTDAVALVCYGWIVAHRHLVLWSVDLLYYRLYYFEILWWLHYVYIYLDVKITYYITSISTYRTCHIMYQPSCKQITQSIVYPPYIMECVYVCVDHTDCVMYEDRVNRLTDR